MKTIILSLVLFGLVNIKTEAQILNFSAAIQEQNQWCWAGASKSILDYYGDTTLQCEIAEYTRSVATWHNFGNTDCCNDPTQGCNYWNYNYGSNGSIQDILIYFGGINNYGSGIVLTKSQIASNLSHGKPFVIRWAWYSGGGHFVVGYGKTDSTIYYMNPWFGEGLKFANYSWVKDNGIHYWTHTNIMLTAPDNINDIKKQDQNHITILPNPSNGNFVIKYKSSTNNAKLIVLNAQGRQVFSRMLNKQNTEIELKGKLNSGLYFMQIIDNGIISSARILIL